MDLFAALLGVENSGLAEHGQVSRDDGYVGRAARGDLRDVLRLAAAGQSAENLHAGRIAERLEELRLESLLD